MGRPRMIILIRHAQSEGNQDRQIHQHVPDHRVKLTDEGWNQANEAGRRLRKLLKPSDTLQFYTSPYRRTRETTDGILQTLTADDPEPSPFSRNSIKIYEEPRLREQDFGNFQPSSADMEIMWKERANYGHFFYRIPNGESAADAYDRVSGFNETLFRSFHEDDFPSVCVLVTHGLMTRVFLMRWYHWSVEYFEDLRNINHCEFVILNRSHDSGKFRLENRLRTWSELKKQRLAEEQEKANNQSDSASPTVPHIPVRRAWNARRQDSIPMEGSSSNGLWKPKTEGQNNRPIAGIDGSGQSWGVYRTGGRTAEDDEEAFPSVDPPAKVPNKNEGSDSPVEPPETEQLGSKNVPPGVHTKGPDKNRNKNDLRTLLPYATAGRGFRGSPSGSATPLEMEEQQSTDLDYFKEHRHTHSSASSDGGWEDDGRRRQEEPSELQKQRWSQESGMGGGANAERLGDARGVCGGGGGGDDDDGGGANLSDQERRDKSVGGSVY